jgi:hypothetical protein
MLGRHHCESQTLLLRLGFESRATLLGRAVVVHELLGLLRQSMRGGRADTKSNHRA